MYANMWYLLWPVNLWSTQLLFSFCERRSLDFGTVKAILSWIVKSPSARAISCGSSLSNIPQCSVIYLSETCPPLAFEMNDIVLWGLLLSIFSEYCVVCIVLFGNEWYCTLGGCYYQYFHSIVIWQRALRLLGHSMDISVQSMMHTLFLKSSWMTLAMFLKFISVMPSNERRYSSLPMCDIHLLNILEMVGWDTFNRYAKLFSLRFNLNFISTITSC